ncbi:MAG: MarR family winged helix-turn-helix transcriptional regulator [Armatimonadota bacterium]|nr:MarR family winged helix-turn-helix transcriptional regulator [Armatimonadota bacterium]MDR7486399.1 MarR family winged helix-turn-helix transcriptional regulator [Armatimonadota bacterium]MDR7532531.1 MarR family winged helix-turn-helix transcriptional regulator [Armatimonadota bacterium]MDR7535579.1 MarR family winged helix-turn-helix transcriptional regulator [Armatimonadota bacterium]
MANHTSFETGGEPLQRRITAGLEKVALALRQASRRGAGRSGLTPTQGLILTVLRRHPAGQRLSMIAATLGVTRASASQTISTLARKGLVTTHPAAGDGRARCIVLAPRGRREAARALSWGETVDAAVDTLDPAEQVVLLRALVKIIRALQEAGQIAPSRMCVTCRYFRPHVHADPLRPHHCAFVDAAFGDRALRVDCPDHMPAPAADAARTWKAFVRTANQRMRLHPMYDARPQQNRRTGVSSCRR